MSIEKPKIENPNEKKSKGETSSRRDFLKKRGQFGVAVAGASMGLKAEKSEASMYRKETYKRGDQTTTIIRKSNEDVDPRDFFKKRQEQRKKDSINLK